MTAAKRSGSPAGTRTDTRGVTERTRTIIETIGLILLVLAIGGTVVLLLPLIWACIAFAFITGGALVAFSQVAKAESTP